MQYIYIYIYIYNVYKRPRLQLRWMKAAGRGPLSYGLDAVRRHGLGAVRDRELAEGLFALAFQLVGLAATAAGCFLLELVERPVDLKGAFLPSMPWDENLLIYEAMRAERVTWWRCPRGHLYSVGECGGPVMATRCSHPGCGLPIGGRNHVAEKGNRRVGTVYEMRGDRRLPAGLDPARDAAAGGYRPGYTLDPEVSAGYGSNAHFRVERIGYAMPREPVCFLIVVSITISSTTLSLSLSLYIYIYICIYVLYVIYIYIIYTYIYIYIYTYYE